ncbi:pyridoxal-dependent decarboxylase, exosortase A system-associated [Sphingomonas sp. CJ99]
MKPTGPIPPDYADQHRLSIAGRPASDWLAESGDGPCVLYDFAVVAARIAALRTAMPPGLDVHYAIKANPYPPLLAAIAPLVDGLDVASAGELALAGTLKSGSAISFAGPGKRDAELDAAILAGATLNLESEGEAARALAIGDRLGIAPRLAVRVNPDFELRGSGMKMGGRASPFGVDAERVPPLVRAIVAGGADWRGFHLYAGSQSLDADALCDTMAASVALAARLADEAGHAPPLVNLGGGFGIPYFAGDEALDIAAIGRSLAVTLDGRPEPLRDSGFAIELGRWLVGECGVYLTRIVDVKDSRDERFYIVDGGLHHQLAASGNFGTVVRRNYPVALADRMRDTPGRPVSVVGCLCTPLDRLADRVALPDARPGDVVALFLAGAYGVTASPAAFLGHPPATERLVGTD